MLLRRPHIYITQAIFIRTLSSIEYPRDNCILRTLELAAVRLAMHGYTGGLQIYHPTHLAAFVSEFSRLKLVRQRVGGSSELTFSIDFCVAIADGLTQLHKPPPNIRKVLACAPAKFKKKGSSTVYNAAAIEEMVPSLIEKLPLSVMASENAGVCVLNICTPGSPALSGHTYIYIYIYIYMHAGTS